MLTGKTGFQTLMMTEEERKLEIIKDFTRDYLREVEKLVEKQGKKEFLKTII